MDLAAERLDILRSAAAQRARDVMLHQVNIDNYTRAIAEIGADPDLADFARQLDELLASSRVEQAKERVLLKVINDQLEEADALDQA